jgi:hypothetical protein
MPLSGSPINNGSQTVTVSAVGFVTYTSGVIRGNTVSYGYFNNPNHNAMSVNYMVATFASPFNVPISFAAWINLDTSAYTTAFGFRSIGPITSGPYGFQFDINTSPLVPLFALALPGMWTVIDGSTISAYTWVHVALTVTSGLFSTIYVNGSPIQSATGTAVFPGIGELVIGAPGDNSRSYNGYIYDVRMYNRAITQAEITAIYNMQ